MNKWRVFTPLIIIVAVSIALPQQGRSEESPKIEKATLERRFIAEGQRYMYLFKFDFVNDLKQPIEIMSVNVFDGKGERVKPDWAMSGSSADPRLLTHELSGNHPLAQMFSKKGQDGTFLEQANISGGGSHPKIKVTNRVLSSGEGVRPSKYVLQSKDKYDSLSLRVVYRVDGNLREVSHTFPAREANKW
jgi:hypothetical protein